MYCYLMEPRANDQQKYFLNSNNFTGLMVSNKIFAKKYEQGILIINRGLKKKIENNLAGGCVTGVFIRLHFLLSLAM